jgi:outer membrane protein
MQTWINKCLGKVNATFIAFISLKAILIINEMSHEGGFMKRNIGINSRLKMVYCAAVLIIICLVSVSSRVFAETLELNLDDAIKLGLKNSLDVKSKQLSVNAAQKDVKSAKAAYYPGISAGTGYSHQFDVNQQGAGTTAYNPDQLDVSLDLSQTIYTFGRLKSSVQVAEKNKQLADIDLSEAKRSLAVSIRRAFYTYLLAKDTLDVKEETLVYMQEALDNANERYDAGLTIKREVLQAESDLQGFVPELIAARNDVKYTLLKLRNIMGVGNGTEVVIKGKLEAAEVPLESEKLIQTAFSNNSNIEQYRTNIALQEITTRLSGKDKLPSISGFAGVSLQKGFNIEGGFTGYEWGSSISAGLRVKMDFSSLFPWSSNTADVEKNRIEIERINTDLEALQDEVKLNIESILLNLSEGRAKIEAGEKAMEVAQDLFNSSKEMYMSGLISSMEYNDAEIKLKDSRVSYLGYIHDYNISLCDLMDSIGADHI